MLRAINQKLKITKTQSSRYYSIRNKLVSLQDAVAVVHTGNTISVSGFVAQGCPEALCAALGDRYLKTGAPKDLTLIFEGGPGDWDMKGLNHFAHPGMLKRAIGAHYGQTPQIAKLALSNKIEAYNLPMGSVSRMIRATASKSPGHFTTIGMGTFVDPRLNGGKINSVTKEDIIEVVNIGGKEYLWYKSIPIQVAFIRGTTADPEGNITLEHESLLGDVRNVAMAAKNSGGIVVAQVKRIASSGSINPRAVHVPHVLVDCVYQVPTEEHITKHPMSYFTVHNPAWSGEIREPLDVVPELELDERKIIARRAALQLKPHQVVNLGIGMPEGVASVANEEKVLKYVTLTTEPGVIGGLGASGHNFGPASNNDAIVELNQQFDFYNGGGLNICYLGLAQCNQNGDVNVSRLSESHLTGPGGFMDISQSTLNVVFMGSFTAKGLEVKCENGKLVIVKEGKVKKFVKSLLEVSFSGKEATKRGQNILYVTERAVFKRVPKGLELIEIAPGVDLKKDILDQMDFEPIIRQPLKVMDVRIFNGDPMGLEGDWFETDLQSRLLFNKEKKTLFIDFSGITVKSKEDVREIRSVLETNIKSFMAEVNDKINVVVNYDGFDCRKEVTEMYAAMVQDLQSKYYKDVQRYGSHAFRRIQLGDTLNLRDENKLWSLLDKDGHGKLSRAMLRKSLVENLNINITEEALDKIMEYANEDGCILKETLPNFLHLLM
eukprot:TRINITY_DN4485_c0_g1_i3.p1 TRINITY_DN4485_c0_g1~~TRINITY_DN4485_c0_g1_i3.p1  ORF type:complete len:719 (-),score=195.32 TRINITY_DN4485_c0_g1_i3:259-2415(-)